MKIRTILTTVLIGAAVTLVAVAPADARTPTLTYKKAKRAAQKRANKIAHKKTKVTTMLRENRRRYFSQAEWTYTDPDGCKGCEFDPDTGVVSDGPSQVSCFVDLIVRFKSKRSRKVVTRLQDKVCF